MQHPARPHGLGRKRAGWIVARGGNALFDTVAITIGGGNDSARGEGTRFLRRLEAVVSRLLLVCVLIGLANSNPRLRQVLDALPL